ncbi:NifU family protein [Xanthobacter sp. V0B-10]|uniref:NifU family protein n=1 Tax=Xanthobacter albus TaxID=3119929 RepID=UPI00372A2637
MLAETEELKTEQRQPATDRQAEREAIIRAVIEEVRPNLKRDGGDCELVEIDGNKVMVKMTGACVFCKLASETIEGIQSKIVERLGELVRLIPVAGSLNKPLISLKAKSI